jgi:hypothetical protein
MSARQHKPRTFPFSIHRFGKDWVVRGKSGTLAYASTDYAKAVGVHEYLEQRWREQLELERREKEG